MNYDIIFNNDLNVSILPQNHKKNAIIYLILNEFIVETLNIYYKIIENNGAIKLQPVW